MFFKKSVMINSRYNKLIYIIFYIFLQATLLGFPSYNEPRVLIMRQRKRGTIYFGGVATHTLSLYKSLLEANIKTYILVPAFSIPTERLKQDGLPFFTFGDSDTFNDHSNGNFGDADSMYNNALNICKNYKINIIHINFYQEIAIAKKICSSLNKTQKIKIVYQHHGQFIPSVNKVAGVSAIIWLNKNHPVSFKEKTQPIRVNLPPLPQINQNKKINKNLMNSDFFKKKFKIAIHSSIPILCCVAHFFECKNHINLFKAINKLIYEYNYPVQLMLAGDGTTEMTTTLKHATKKLKISDYVYFLGFVKNVPELLFYSNISLLLSKKEPFGLPALESALINKPIVISKNTGVTNTFIFHEKTGLVCNPHSADDIALKIKYLIDNPLIAKSLGNAAYDSVSKFYLKKEGELCSPCILEYINLYKDVLKM
jgi:glycosyltransferase involved in cell wall biosynthesis